MTPANAGALAERLEERAVEPGKSGPTIGDRILAQQAEIRLALPLHMDVERFTRLVLTEVRTNPKLLQCSFVSLMSAVMKAATLGLEPGPLGHAYLVPFWNGRTQENECTFILGYTGMIRLALNSPDLQSFDAETVHQHDEFSYELGLHPKLVHKPARGDRGPATEWYVIARFTDGGTKFSVRDKTWIESRRGRSKSGKDNQGPWKSDYDAMALKSVLRGMSRWLPLTVEAAEAFAGERDYIEGEEAGPALPEGPAIEAEVSDPEDTPDAGSTPPPPRGERRPGSGEQEAATSPPSTVEGPPVDAQAAPTSGTLEAQAERIARKAAK